MRVRTYFWHDRVVSKPRLILHRLLGRDDGRSFGVGNAGDLFAADLIRHLYGAQVVNDASAGRRLLVVGSIAHRVREGDILAGPGLLSDDRPPPPPPPGVRLVGLRGPLTYEAFRSAGYDMTGVKFLLDPGLLIGVTLGKGWTGSPKGVVFIPHFRDRAATRGSLPARIRMLDIDATPRKVAREVSGAELVYSSSLHGIIFAHALGRPCVLVQPRAQPLLKYRDYYASVGLPFPAPLASIQDADFRLAPISPADVVVKEEAFAFPEMEVLQSAGIAA